MIEFVVGFFVRSTVILGLAWLATSLLRRAAADVRHRIWLAALIGVAIAAIPMPVPEPLRIEVQARGAMGVAAPLGIARMPNIWLELWALGAVLIGGRLLVALALLARWTRQAACLDGCLFSDSVATAITWGFRKPVIVLPGYMRSWTPDGRAMVLYHERAHIARRDWLWQTFAQLSAAVFWFQPLMWVAAARLRNEAEQASDDLVLQNGASPIEYAANLIEAARRLQGTVPRVALAMAGGRSLPSRIRAILDAGQTRQPANKRARLMILAASAGLLVMLAACQSAHIYKVAELTAPPRVASKVEPQYTDDARDRKIAGKVGLNLVIDAQGRAENIRVTQSLDKGLDANAIAAVQKWTFDPGKKDGKPVRTAAVIEVNYHLQ